MIEIRQYILSVICMVTLCGLMRLLLPTGTVGTLVKFLCGLLVTITVVRPLLQEQLFEWDMAIESIRQDQERAIWEGENYTQERLSQFITQKTEAYILTKASEWGANVTAEVLLQEDSPYLPTSATIQGFIAPYAKQQLAEYMEDELGIAKEAQIWIS